ncbi:MAG: iron-sulfur cluster assembly accessory protein [Candidatus Omnitrophica bacterium]|nr:iron-sulfur cluster assembly accessory protein [Candidatus Omnitrophota bacterium]
MNNTNVPNTAAPLVTLTDAAVEKVKSMMGKEGKEGYALRFGVVTGGCAGLSYEMKFQKTPYDNDIAFEHKGLKVIVNQESTDFVRGIEIDYVDTLRDSGFKYRNPNAKSSCGCGTSFS